MDISSRSLKASLSQSGCLWDRTWNKDKTSTLKTKSKLYVEGQEEEEASAVVLDDAHTRRKGTK